MAKGLKVEVFGYRIMCENSGKWVIKTCSQKFAKMRDLKKYTRRMRARYIKKYANKNINGVRLGKTICIDFFIRRKK